MKRSSFDLEPDLPYDASTACTGAEIGVNMKVDSSNGEPVEPWLGTRPDRAPPRASTPHETRDDPGGRSASNDGRTSGSIAGIDLSPEMVKRTQLEARQRAMQNVTAECMDAEELQFSDCSFDTVFCGLSLSFFPDPGKTLTGFKRVLKPGGTLAVSIWGPGDARWIWLGDVYEKFQPFFLADPNITPVHFHEASTLEIALREAGFQNVRIMEDRKEFVYLDFDEWWAVQWSHVNRAVLESLPPEVMDDFKEDLSRHIKSVQEPDGIHQVFCVLHALAVK